MRHLAPLALAGLIAASFAPSSVAQPVTIGEHVVERFETPHPYVGRDRGAPELLWVDEISHPGATYIAPHFSRFELAPSDRVIIRSADGRQSWTYRGLGKANLGNTPDGFFAVHIKGDTAIIELYGTVGGGYGYTIDKYGRGYNDDEIQAFWDAGLGEKMNLPYPRALARSVCTGEDSENARCYEVSEPQIYNSSRAVARLTLNGSAHCTGWLVGCEGHLMTNEHCIGSQSQLNNIDFEFMAEGATCATNCRSSLACPGTIEASGGTLVQVDAPLDYALVVPDTSVASGTDLPATYGFMRLRATGAVLNERVYHPQHPAGWGKQIVVESSYPSEPNPPFASIVSLNETACSGGPPDVGYWSDTQGGSSGSPVLAYSDHRVVALHHCRGSAFCTSGNPNTDDPNRGVPIQAVIADLGANVPNCAVCDEVAAPSGLTATPNGGNRIDLAWTASPAATSYKVLRAIGSCPQAGYEVIASGVAGTSYSDPAVSGGTTYSYVVQAVDDATGCFSSNTACADALATGVCNRAPDFAGLASVANAAASTCSLNLSWAAATGHCGNNVVYNVFRSTTAGFTPGPASQLATCVGGTSYSDATALSGTRYYYVVQAEDDSGNGSGACNGGNSESNTVEKSSLPTGPDQVAFNDDLEGPLSNWATAAGPGNTGAGTTPWTLVSTASHSPANAYFCADQNVKKEQLLSMVGSVALPASLPATLEFWHQFDTEPRWDGGVLEISLDGGTTWNDILNGNSARFLVGGYNDTMNTSVNVPISGRLAWTGASLPFSQVRVDLADFQGQNVRFRWRFACDTSVGDVGWWLDDVRISAATSCVTGAPIFSDGFESQDTSAWTLTQP